MAVVKLDAYSKNMTQLVPDEHICCDHHRKDKMSKSFALCPQMLAFGCCQLRVMILIVGLASLQSLHKANEQVDERGPGIVGGNLVRKHLLNR